MKYLAPGIAAALLLLTSAAIGAWWFTLREDALASNARLERSITNYQRQGATLQADLERYESLESEHHNELARLTATLDTIEARIPDTADFTRMMRTVSELADTHALRITRIYHLDTNELEPGLHQLTYDIATTGTFEDTIRFIQDLHLPPRLIAVTRFRLATASSRDNPTPTPTITLHATITTLARTAPTPPEQDHEPDQDHEPEPSDDPPVLGHNTPPQGGPA